MNKVHTDKLLKDFPKLYSGYYEGMQHTCMCWGFSCGDGWYDLIYKLSTDLVAIDPNLKATQVKEKFGGLRFYTEGYDRNVQIVISRAEEESYKTCEECGSTEDVTQTKGYIISLCPKCKVEHEKPTPNRDMEETIKEINRVRKQSGQKPVGGSK